MKTRYLITYKNNKIDTGQAQSILGKPDQDLFEGVKMMSGDYSSSINDVFHFEKLGISSVGLTESEAQRLVNRKEILAVEKNFEVHILGFEDRSKYVVEEPTIQNSISWNIEMINARHAWNRSITGSGINLAILDTGVSNHPDLNVKGGVSFVRNAKSYADGHGHGTHCAGIATANNPSTGMFGVAKDCNLFAVKVLSDRGSGNADWVISGLEWCIQQNMDVASLSLGGPVNPSLAFAEAIQRCKENGVAVICATGNEYGTPFPWVGSPANSFESGNVNASPIAVGAIDRYRRIAHFSSRGKNGPYWNPVTVVAPGVRIKSTFKHGSYKVLNGTSMACPHVAGLAALIKQRFPTFSPHHIELKIMQTAKALGHITPNEAHGYGLIDCDKATI